jgi:hypothetical protein
MYPYLYNRCVDSYLSRYYKEGYGAEFNGGVAGISQI